MTEPTLIIMAAGMGSRYGGLKQIDAITDKGEIILDFSLYDAMKAGFKRAIFIIKKEMETDFRRLIDNRAGAYFQTEYVFQRLEDIPNGFAIPRGRKKPWGTAHAVLSCRHLIDGPFAVINADDCYGPGSFQNVYDFLVEPEERQANCCCMAGFKLGNTIMGSGQVARRICELAEDGRLAAVTERKKIMRRPEGIAYTEDDGETWHILKEDMTVSMNFWGYRKDMMREMEQRLPSALERILTEDPLKGEYLLPTVTDELIKTKTITVKVLPSHDKWYGVTYREDKDAVKAALQSMKDKGLYPERLWNHEG
ncbi:MAG: nucleotidyltransferase [Firmicutes bacterium]|nr:nucleotidyltransferase [Bacillota bacterium]